MSKVGVVIDGKAVLAEKGSNLLEAALANGIDVPHLCYDPRLKPFGSCRLCFVEITGRPAAVPACGAQVSEGMEVTTRSEKLSALRRAALELLVAEHCGDCIAPCQQACPAGIDIQGFIAHMANGRHKMAAALIKEKMPLPSVCGRVCPRFCEEQCRRNMVDEAVNICALKRYAGDFDLKSLSSYAPWAKADTGFTVAVVGGGPAGLTAAYYLALKGHRVTLFDQGPELGGMLRYGIPEYRLPKKLLDREIDVIAALCHEVRLGERFGLDYQLWQLQEQYDAVFLAMGCQSAQGLGLEGEDLPGMVKGIDFLRKVVEGRPPEIGRRVAVVGGGNTAMDAARTALRLGAEEVAVIYRRSRSEMPASPVEIHEAEEEGVAFHYLTNPTLCLVCDGRVSGLECIGMELGEPDSSGRRRPVPVPGTEMTLEFDTVILAIGQSLEENTAIKSGLPLSRRKTIDAAAGTGVVALAGVFAAGDCVSGPATVVEAVAAARKSAEAIDSYLNGKEPALETEPFNCSMGELKDLDPVFFREHEKIPRTPEIHQPPLERVRHFNEFNLGLSKDSVQHEVKRCLSCGCDDVFDCTLRKLATEYEVETGRLGVGEKRYSVVQNHRYIAYDANKCVLCGNCVRICQEVMQIGALGFANRGYDTVVLPSMGLPLAETMCESCSQCVSACPTGALTRVSFKTKPGPFRADSVVASTCVQCSTGCDLELHMVGSTINKVTTPLRGEINGGNLCKKGAFEYQFVHSPGRLKAPLLKNGGALAETGWEEALTAAAAMLQKIRDRYGPESLAVLVSPRLSNEENYLAQKLARLALRTNNVESTHPLPLAASYFTMGRPVSYSDLAISDFILVLSSDPTVDYPIVAQKIRQAADGGCKLAVVSQQVTRLDSQACLTVRTNPKKMLKLLQIILAYLRRYELFREQLELSLTETEIKHLLLELPDTVRVKPARVIELVHLLVRAKRPIVVTDGAALGAAELAALQEIVRSTGNNKPGRGMLTLYPDGNARGQLDMGVHPALLPGRQPLDDAAACERYRQAAGQPLPAKAGMSLPQIVAAAKNGDIVGLVIVGDDFSLEHEIFEDGIFTVAVTSTWRSDLNRADVVLPAATFAETRGTVTNSEGRLRKLVPALLPLAGRSNTDILSDLASALGVDFPVTEPHKILEEMQKISKWELLQEGNFFKEPEEGIREAKCKIYI